MIKFAWGRKVAHCGCALRLRQMWARLEGRSAQHLSAENGEQQIEQQIYPQRADAPWNGRIRANPAR